MSPYEMTYGCEMPGILAYDNPLYKPEAPILKDRAEMDKRFMRLLDEAAEKYKRSYDKSHVPKEFKKGDLVWLQRHDQQSGLDVECDGPFVIEEVKSPLVYRLGDVSGARAKLGKRHRVVNIQQIKEFTQTFEKEKEEVVVNIDKHRFKTAQRKRKKYKKVEYQVNWDDGDTTWELLANLIDKTMSGEIVINEALKNYWKLHPEVRRMEGY
jgi:hypothetical protein